MPRPLESDYCLSMPCIEMLRTPRKNRLDFGSISASAIGGDSRVAARSYLTLIRHSLANALAEPEKLSSFRLCKLELPDSDDPAEP